MVLKIMRIVVCFIVLVFLTTSHADATDAVAFVAEVKGKARIGRAAGGTPDPAAVGSQLFAGDEMLVDEGQAVLIFTSGRTIKVDSGTAYKVQGGMGQAAPLISRIMDTLEEISGPQSEAEKPVVHGMARDVAGLNGALPFNTLVRGADFTFSWDQLDGVESYEFTLKDENGELVARQPVAAAELAAKGFNLKRGKRYHWSVKEIADFLPRSSGEAWIQIDSAQDSEALKKELSQLEADYNGEALELLALTVLFKHGYFYEVERSLIQRQAQRSLSKLERRMLMTSYAQMQRLERLPQPEKE
jgi:hypothetical protein